MIAFDDDVLVGYMSCIKRESFIPLGFPWVLSEYEEKVQEKLFQSVYGFASGPLGGKKFLQRFREEWETQISFF